MAFKERLPLIKAIQEQRGSAVICYLTSVRAGVAGNMAQDQVRVFFDHLLLLKSRPIEKLDIFLVSNGGDSVVPWRLVSLFREFANSFNVIIPYRAYSAATLLALGADEIVMHPFAELGPIDPTVQNDFNPREQGTGRVMGISVEDVKAYVNFIKTSVGITHEDELVEMMKVLADKVHPLALGNVERFVSQSRMMAKKILKTHMREEEKEHAISEVVETMSSKLYFHGHPINRREAKEDLRLKVLENVAPELESKIWELYKDFEAEFENGNPFNAAIDLAAIQPKVTAAGATGVLNSKDYLLVHAMIESERLCSKNITRRRFTLQAGAQPGQKMLEEEILEHTWNHSLA